MRHSLERVREAWIVAKPYVDMYGTEGEVLLFNRARFDLEDHIYEDAELEKEIAGQTEMGGMNG